MKPLTSAADLSHADDEPRVCVKIQAYVGVSGLIFPAADGSYDISES